MTDEWNAIVCYVHFPLFIIWRITEQCSVAISRAQQMQMGLWIDSPLTHKKTCACTMIILSFTTCTLPPPTELKRIMSDWLMAWGRKEKAKKVNFLKLTCKRSLLSVRSINWNWTALCNGQIISKNGQKIWNKQAWNYTLVLNIITVSWYWPLKIAF